MGKVFKWLAAILAGIVVLTGISVAVMLSMLDEDTVKGQLTQLAHEATGGELQISGALGWSVFPQIGLSVEQIQFTPAAEETPLATVDRLSLGVDFLPLLRGNINIGQVTLNGARLDLVSDQDGVGNWEKLSPAPADAAAEAAATTADAAPTAAASGADEAEAAALTLAISRIQITDTEVSHTDLQSGARRALSDFNLDSRGVNLQGGEFPASIGFTVTTNAPELAIDVTIDTGLSGDLATRQFRLTGTTARIAATGEPTGHATVTTEFSTDARIDLDADTAALENLVVELANLTLRGDFHATALSAGPQLRGHISSNSFNPRQLAAELAVALPGFVDDSALTRASLAADLGYDGRRADIDNLAVELDQTTISGSLALTDLSRQAIAANLAVDQINLDHYQLADEESSDAEPPGGEEDTSEPQEAGAVTPLPLLPVDAIKALDLDARLSVGTLVANQVELTDVSMQLTAKDGMVDLSKLRADLYQGHTELAATIDVRPAEPAWTFKGVARQVQLGPLLAAAAEIDLVEGVADLDGQLSTSGNQVETLKRNLQGPASFRLAEGVLKETNLERLVCQAVAAANRETLTATWDTDTQLNDIEGTLRFYGGQINNSKLTAGLDNAQLQGSGSVNMLTEEIDYRMGIRIVGKPEEVDPACRVNERYRDIFWPLRCRGSLDDSPSKMCGVDRGRMDDVTKQMLEQELKREAEKRAQKLLEDKAEDLVDDKTKTLLDDALKRFLR